MRVKKQVDRLIKKIAKQIIKQTKLPNNIKRFIDCDITYSTLTLNFYYMGYFVCSKRLVDEIGDFWTVSWLSACVHDEMVEFAAKKCLQDFNQGERK